MRDLVEDIFVKNFDNELLAPLEDQARMDLTEFNALGPRLVMTTDSYVVDPIFFPGGDIGKLAVAGTVNDLAVSGATALYLSAGMIIEEGFAIKELNAVVKSMQKTANSAGVKIVTGDTKVVHKNSADKIYINTAGIGVVADGINISAKRARPGDKVLVNGFIGDHGAAIVGAREDMALKNNIQSDCGPLNHLIRDMLKVCPDIHCMRDATRGGVATVLNEFAAGSKVAIKIYEKNIKIRDEVRGMCEILGFDPLYLANEGKLVAIVPEQYADKVLDAMCRNPAGRDSVIIGEVVNKPEGVVFMSTLFGAERMLDMLVGEQLPRIC